MVLIWEFYLEMKELLLICWTVLGIVNSTKTIGFSSNCLREAISNKSLLS